MSTARHHAEWLSLVEINGPFLSLPVLLRVFPQGLDEVDADLRRELRLAYDEWRDNQQGLQPEPAIHRAWINYVLTRVLALPAETLAEGQAIPSTLSVTVAQHQETLRPDWVVLSDEFSVLSEELVPTQNSELKTQISPLLLIQIYPPGQPLDKAIPGHRWQASPESRMVELCHAANVRLGLVTNGEQWLLVNAPRGETTGFVSWYAELWLEEKLTLRAFRSLLGVERFFAAPEEETLPALLAQSQSEQHEVTDQLGYQVRRAVEVLVQAIDLADRDRGGTLLAGVPESRLYEAALTLMMRLVFLFSAEERGLFPLDDELYNQNYAASTLREQLREAADQFGEAVIERRLDAWVRLLAIFRAIHSGIQHERLRLPAYGGSLFDPDRFPFLEGRPEHSSWRETEAEPLPINNRTVLHLLEALQLLQVRVPGGGPSETRRLSFRALDIEQIGHVYESLLDHTAVRAGSVVLGLAGSKYNEPEVSLAALEAFLVPSSQFGVQSSEKTVQSSQFKVQGSKQKTMNYELGTVNPELINYLKEQTGRSENALKKVLSSQFKVQSSNQKTTNSELGTRNSELRIVCGNNEALYRRVLPFAGLLRDDDLGHPVVILPGSVYVTAGTERRATGTHYTPRSLTEPIVQHTLEPLVYTGPAEGQPPEKWRLKSPAALLNLKICDMAMGSGAFLVQTCRFLSERLVEAWEQAEEQGGAGAREKKKSPPLLGSLAPQPSGSLLTPEGQPTTNPDEAIPANPADRLIYAKRLVADRCLHGVDKNPLAVEMAKLSLWLITLDKNRPFTFLDHALKGGDSLVGVNLDQLTTWNLAGEGKRAFETLTIQSQIERMIALRRQLEAIPVNSVADQEAKRLLFEEAEAVAHDLRRGGDMLVGSYFNDLGRDEQEYLRVRLLAAARDGANVTEQDAAQANLGDLRPFHWPLEFPEVFLAEGRGGFDAFVGNPPFLGGQRISTMFGDPYFRYLRLAYPNSRGTADLCAFFFLRAFEQLHASGTFGLVATNTIAQGDTRETGLEYIVKLNGTIYEAHSLVAWPGVAAVSVSIIHSVKGGYKGIKTLDGKSVPIISALLDSTSVVGNPKRLTQNSRKSFVGSYLLGTGFTMSPEEAQQWIANDAKNSDVLFPYLSGQDLNSRFDQTPSRWTINFFDWPLEKAEQYPDCLDIVRRLVKPHRDTVKRTSNRERWWLYAENRPGLYSTISSRQRVLVCSRVSKYLSFAFAPLGWVYSEATVIIASDRDMDYSILQSTIHEIWTRKYASSLETRLRYTPADVFETFPFPHPDSATPIPALDAIGEAYHGHRRQMMLARQEGLTAAYNRFHNPDETAEDIARLRELHLQMDQAVAAAYGWSDLALGHGFHDTPQGLRYTLSESARREVLGRLLALNHQRYEAEVKAGLHSKGGRRKDEGGKKGAAGPVRGKQVSLPGMEDGSPQQLGLFGEE